MELGKIMAAQAKGSGSSINETREVSTVSKIGIQDLDLPENYLQEIPTLKGILPVLLMLQTGWIITIEPLEMEGLRFYIQSDQNQIHEQTIQALRRMLERLVNTPINIYWNSEYIDFIPM